MGEETLIKVVVQSIPSFVMSIAKLPKSFCDKLASMAARFWWWLMGKDRGIHWVKWEVVSRKKRDGGVGFRDFESMNISLLVKFLKSVYFPNHCIWEVKKVMGASW